MFNKGLVTKFIRIELLILPSDGRMYLYNSMIIKLGSSVHQSMILNSFGRLDILMCSISVPHVKAV